MLCLIFIIISTVSLQAVQTLFHNDSRTDYGSCRFRSVRQAEFIWNSGEQSMTESFVLDDIEYKLCRYHVTWDEALVFCTSYEAHLATLDSEEKTALVVQAMASISSVSEEYWIGAKQMYEDPWKWISNGMTLSTEEDIISKISIWYPGFELNNMHCLTIDRSGHDDPIFVPRACNQRRGFICQRENDRAFDNKIRMVAATRIGKQEFRLYAGRISWAEAAVHCRQEGLQIGEVNTVEEARALAISMLRNRPEGIESVWIGGYTRKDDENTWRWLASGEKIENNDMWRKDLSESSGGCLLLDRHVCETPVYVESSCDRKRDVLCQKPPKKLLSKTPVPVVVDNCPYWVGFYPLKWLDARRACESLNASLVVLDSPATISHMMSLMLDNKAELRHIWTNGHRSKSDGQWIWDVTGESIPDFGKSFIPWCPDDDYYTKENSCLNLDREKLDSPLVYGLSCREKQTYVCQPYIGDCVFHSTAHLPLDGMINASEDIEEETTFEYPSTLDKYMATLTMSTVTTPFSIVDLNDDIIQTTLHSKNSDLSDFTIWKSSENIVEKNSSSQRKSAQNLRPFTRFTLPSLPQFGIKVVSATEATTNLPSVDMKTKKNKAYKLLTTSTHASAATNFSPPSVLSTSVKKGQNDGREASNDQVKNSNMSNSHVATISSVSTESTNEKSSRIIDTSRPAFTQISPSLQSFWSSKNSTKFSTTSSSTVSHESSEVASAEVDRTKKYSMKTTRALNSSDTATTKYLDSSNPTNKRIITSNSKSLKNLSPKTIDSFVPKKTRPHSTFVARKRPNFRITTETSTPYDAIDMEYYNDDKYDKSAKKGTEEKSRKSGDPVEYSEDYETISSTKKGGKKKSKHTSIASSRRNLSTSPKAEEEEEEGEEESSEEEEDLVKSPLPLAAELSKNLESAFVTMMKNGLDKKNGEKSTGLSTPKIDTKTVNTENVAWLKEEDNKEAGLKSVNVKGITFRPYYAFEGPMIADLSEVMKGDGGTSREFTFVGGKLTPEGFGDMKNLQQESKNDLSKLLNNEIRSQPNPQQSSPQNQSNFPISMMDMPPIQPNDPNSMMQLGRYFKNQIDGLKDGPDRQVQDRRSLMTIPRERIERNGQRRYGLSERPFLQGRIRSYPVNREEDIRKKGQQWNMPIKRPGMIGTDTNYYAGPRRIYPRQNHDFYESLSKHEGRNNETRLIFDREKSNVTWSDKHVANYHSFDLPSQTVSPKSFPAPIRTTRSFHERSHYFKNQFDESPHGPDRQVQDRRSMMMISRKEIESNGQKRFRPSQKPFFQERIRGYPVSRQGDIRNKGQQRNEPIKEPRMIDTDTNYYAGGRRLHLRENHDFSGSLSKQEGRYNERRLKNDREKLSGTWSDKYVVNDHNFDLPSQLAYPKSSPAPIRTTRSFHEKIGSRTMEAIEEKSFPDFKLSKLVKEVKIDLDQRMLRRYLEGFSKKIGSKSLGAKNDDWKDTWRQLLRKMLYFIDRININVNGNLMKLRIGSDDRKNKLNLSRGNLKELRRKLGLIANGKQRKNSLNINYTNLVEKMNETLRINSTVENRHKLMRGPHNNLDIKESAEVTSNPEIKGTTTDSYGKSDDNRETTTRSSFENEKMTSTTFTGLHINYKEFGDNISNHFHERTDKPIFDNQENFHQVHNVLNPNYTNSNNTPIVQRPKSIIPEARLFTDFGYRPLMPQLHHRVIFQPGWGQIRVKPGSERTVFKGEYLPEGSLPRTGNNEMKNEHFGDTKNKAQKPEHNVLALTNSTANTEISELEESLKNSFETKTELKSVERKIDEDKSNLRSKVASVSEKSENDSKAQKKSNKLDKQRATNTGRDYNVNGGWRDVPEEIERNKLRNEDLGEYYNATYVEESADRKMNDNEEENRRDMEEEIDDEEIEPPADYDQKPIWTPAHRLSKAMELSMLRKFAANPSNSLGSRNLVTRSVKESEALRPTKSPETASRNSGYTQGQGIVESLESLNEEPSVISLRMIMDPERKSSRFFRQSQDRRTPEKNRRSVELRVKFLGKENPAETVREQINSNNHLTQNEKTNKTLHSLVLSNSGGNVKDKNDKTPVAIEQTLGFVDKERRRAMLNRLRERNRTSKRNHLKNATKRDFQDRKYRNIGLQTNNALSKAKEREKNPNVKHYIATSLRSFDERNLTNSAENMWKKSGKSHGNNLGIDWAEQASALFADLNKSNDDITLYIDLTLGRVGSKPRIGERSKG